MRRAARPCRDAGVSLIEVLIATVILGLSVVAIIGGFGAAIRSGVVYRIEAKAETILRSTGEEVVAQGFKGCVSGELPTFTVASPVDGYTVQVTGVAYWTGANPATFAASCANQGNGVVRVSLRATSAGPGPAVDQQLDVFVRNQS